METVKFRFQSTLEVELPKFAFESVLESEGITSVEAVMIMAETITEDIKEYVLLDEVKSVETEGYLRQEDV